MEKNLIKLLLVLTCIISACPSALAEESTIVGDGAWCWFADPRAMRYVGANDRTYVGYIDESGNVMAAQFDHVTKAYSKVLLKSGFQQDDHNNPTFLVLPDKRIMIFYSMHTTEAKFYYRISVNPEDITTMGAEKIISTTGYGNTTYPSPFIFSSSPNNFYLCWRGVNWHPTIAKFTLPDANDNVSFVMNPTQIVDARTSTTETGKRPYAKYESDGISKLHITHTYDHPDNQTTNSVYYSYLDVTDMSLHDASGATLANVASTPFKVTNSQTNPAHLIFRQTNIRGWVWDIAIGSDGKPVVLMVKISNDKSSHTYYYSKWTGTAWQNTLLGDGGQWFHLNPTSEHCYSGGMSLDHANPNIAYISEPIEGKYGKVYEIVKCETSDGGLNFTKTQTTKDSFKNNIRPFVPRNSHPSEMSVIWMGGDYYYWDNSKPRPGYPTGLKTNFAMDGYSSNNPTDGLMLWYDFKNTTQSGKIQDMSGNGHDGTLVGSASVVNGVLDLTANSSTDSTNNGYMLAPNDLFNGLKSYTFSATVKLSDTASGGIRAYDFGMNSGNSAFLRLTSSPTETMPYSAGVKYNGGTPQMTSSTLKVPKAQWANLVVTYNSTTKFTTVFINGDVVASSKLITNQLDNITDNTNRNYIGRSQWWDDVNAQTRLANPDFKGQIADFRLYNRDLSYLEVSQLAEYGNLAQIDDVSKVDATINSLSLGDTSAVSSNIFLPSQLSNYWTNSNSSDIINAGYNDISVQWTSSNTNYISNTGTVIRPKMGSDPVNVVLTATASKGLYTSTKSFDVTVLPKNGDLKMLLWYDFESENMIAKSGGYYVKDIALGADGSKDAMVMQGGYSGTTKTSQTQISDATTATNLITSGALSLSANTKNASNYSNATNAYLLAPKGLTKGIGANGTYTVTAYVKMPVAAPATARLFDFGTSSSTSMFMALNNATTFYQAGLKYAGASSKLTTAPTSALPNDKWVFVASTYDGMTLKMYTTTTGDVGTAPTSIAVGTTYFSGAIDDSTAGRNYIGRTQWWDSTTASTASANPDFNGQIADFRVYGTALDASDLNYIALESDPMAITYPVDVATDKTALKINGSDSEVITDKDLVLASTGANGSAITWVSSNPSVVKNNGSIVRPSDATANNSATLTATIYKGVITATKTFLITVTPRQGINDNIMLWYDFKNTTTDGANYFVPDVSGNNNDGTLKGVNSTNVSTVVADGILDMSANGKDALNNNRPLATNIYVQAPDGLTNDLRSYTFFAKVKPSDFESSYRLYDFGSNSGQSMFTRLFNSASTAALPSFGVGVKKSTAYMMGDNNVALTANKWVNIVATYDATTGITSLYKDGVLVKADSSSIKVEPYMMIGTDSRNYIGRTQWWDDGSASTSSANADLKGQIDEFRMYSRALTGTEVAQISSGVVIKNQTISGTEVSVVISNFRNSDYDADIIVAVYNGNKLEDISIKDSVLAKNADSTVNLQLKGDVTGKIVKLFVWDKQTKALPIADAYKVQ